MLNRLHVALCLGLLGSTAIAAQPARSAPALPADTTRKLAESPGGARFDDARFGEAIDLIERHYLESLPRAAILERALRALLADLDPYAAYLDSTDWSEMKTNLSAQLGGVGVLLKADEQGGLPRIEKLFYGSPAAAAGARRGDSLARLDGRDLHGITIDELLPLLRGEPGTAVRLELRRDGRESSIPLRVTRAKLDLPSVRGTSRDEAGRHEFMLDPARGIGYIRISRMAEDGVPAVEAAIRDLTRRRMRGLVLDLRASSGGLMRVAREMADLFVDRGTLFGEAWRDSSRTFPADARSLTKVPIVVLIDGETISSSEFLAAALRDAGRARFVGARTYGKARMQQMLALPGGGGLVLTTSKLLRSSGTALDRHDRAGAADSAGIAPDPGLEVVLSQAEYEAWRAEADLRDQPFVLEPSDVAAPAADRVLARAVEVLAAEISRR